jgi:poly-gamma-glutamate capsule biosynthesis protein CapA/YwtB (metallophosphatase superfamily)
MRIFLCGDVMTGRGIDQILPHPCDSRLYERYMPSATDYVRLAERMNGMISAPVDFSYIWGAALEELDRAQPDVRIINLETSVTHCGDYLDKGINYRMSPENARCLLAAGVDCCVLANNHILDWGGSGLLDTLSTLHGFAIKTAGAGPNLDHAGAPAILDAGKGRVVVFAFASPTSGTPREWAATRDAPGVNLLSELSEANIARIAEQVARVRQSGDIIVVSIHWGPNWGYGIPNDQRSFAHALIDTAGVSVVHGHSSHHPKAIEVYRGRLILYGCGDFLNDYEGIAGYEEYRDDLVAMYFATFDPADANLVDFEVVPLQIRRLQLIRPSREDVDWIRTILDRESARYGAGLGLRSAGRLALNWPAIAR